MLRKLGKWTLWGCGFGSLVAGGVIHMTQTDHAPLFWQHLPLFSAAFGLIGCVVIIVASKAIGHHWLQKKEDYYGRNEKGEQEE